ncbi:hypothetical protein GCM10009843_00360 [Nocardioides bigeumensis]|uniref:Uncharacterized protein n=1 Tax=Nocardioides bigeumensis TaxID=433657 RepID=A0ABP5J891_9ACTN
MMTISSLKQLAVSRGTETWIAAFDVTPTRYRESSRGEWQRLKGGDIAFRFVLTHDRRHGYNVSELYQESV